MHEHRLVKNLLLEEAVGKLIDRYGSGAEVIK